MGLQLKFGDTFDHIDTDGIALKWTTGGGAINTDPAHTRMGGPRSLQIGPGDSPTITAGDNATTIGFGYQVESITDAVLFELWADVSIAPAPPELQISLRMNSDGSLTLLAGGVEVVSSVPGVLVGGVAFPYIEVVINLFTGLGNSCLVRVTGGDGLWDDVINTSAFATSQIFWDTLFWVGPITPSYIADFYVSRWDLSDPSTYGAPLGYGVIPPIVDGLNETPGVDPAFVTPPLFPRVDSIPETLTPVMTSNHVEAIGSLGCGFIFDVTSVPTLAEIAALQVCMLCHFTRDDILQDWPPFWGSMVSFTGDLDGSVQINASQAIDNGSLDIGPVFYLCPADLNPKTGDAWSLPDFSGDTALQLGPATEQNA